MTVQELKDHLRWWKVDTKAKVFVVKKDERGDDMFAEVTGVHSLGDYVILETPRTRKKQLKIQGSWDAVKAVKGLLEGAKLED